MSLFERLKAAEMRLASLEGARFKRSGKAPWPTVMFTMRIDAQLMAWLDGWAEVRGMTRSQAVRMILEDKRGR